MRAKLMLLTPIAFFAVNACGNLGAVTARADQFPAAPAVGGSNGSPPTSTPYGYYYPAPAQAGTNPPATGWSNGGFPPSIPHDYPGPALRGGGGGG